MTAAESPSSVRIRLAEERDAPTIRDIYAPAVTDSAISFEEEPPTEAEMRERIADTLPEYPWLVCERGGGDENDDDDRDSEVAGYAYAGRHRKRPAYRWSVDVSVYVAKNHRRAGIARGLYESLFALLRLQGFVNAYAGIALPNDASVALHESFGFEPVGVYESVGYKRGAWRDVGWWQKRLRDRPDDPGDPRSLAEVEVGESEQFESALSAGEAALGR
ncbi:MULTISPECIES: arsinothricin resistance N-acetyltransferase ArsN1 family B [Halorussus]|uniref:arsinothricin resistance N-acetyltransferase ArsN1 family B n=1 Tax=Halorussus TaxID=1070314 RepID=UPI0020A08570|nr:arsinothricin resistance N-acetyltransferase ArsN1 family B [Halorussus vallis]USZ73982.1 GNAT family N-acetyltransferase [Halorussus vallis]